MSHQYHQKILPTNQDLDTEVRHKKQGAVALAWNGRLGSSENSSQLAWENIRSSLKIPFNLPAGENKSLGSVEDKKNKRLYYFIWNSNGYNAIYVYQPQVLNEPIKLLYGDTPDNKILDFNPYYEIKGTKVKVVDGKWLLWTDNYNAPRYLNIEWCYVVKKKWRIEKATTYKVLISGVETTVTHTELSNYFKVDDCDCFNVEQLSNQYEIKEGVALNFYPAPHNERQIDYVLYPPAHAPIASLAKDAKYKRNFLSGFTWQFRVQYKYKNGGYSVWSAWSKLLDTTGKCTENFNSIDIDYSDDIFNLFSDNNQLHLIDKVILGFRNTNLGELYKFVTIDSCKIPKDKQVYRFYNDIHAEIVDQYTNLKQYDTVPLQAGVLNMVQDRVVMGDVVENYDAGCFDFDLDVKFHKKGSIAGIKTGSFRVPILIFNNPEDSYSQPIYKKGDNIYFGGRSVAPNFIADKFGQNLPEGGFVAYLAGTDYMSISKQAPVPLIPFIDDDKKVFDYDAAVPPTASQDPHTYISYAEFKDIPVGTYIIRLASHWCTFGDKLGKGNFYDLDNGKKYQLTSTNLRSVGGNAALREYVVTVTDGMNIDMPIFEIEDCAADIGGSIAGLNARALIQGYFIDSTTASQSSLKEGTRVESAIVEYHKAETAVISANRCTNTNFVNSRTTDHNGYSFSQVTTNVTLEDHYKMLVRKIYPSGTGNFLWNAQHLWEGNLGQLEAETLTDRVNCNVDVSNKTYRDFIYPIQVVDGKSNIQNNYRTHITARVVDGNGVPLKNVKVLVTETSRMDITDVNGLFNILVYTNNNRGRRIGKIILFDDECCFFSKVINFDIQLSSTDYNNTVAYDLGDIVVNACDENKTLTFYLKNGGVYTFGGTLMDRANRKTTVISKLDKHTIRLPFTTENIQDYLPQITSDADGNPITPTTKADGYFSVTMIIKSLPTIWCTHFYPMRTEDQVYAEYLQFIVSDVKYVVKYDETTTSGVTTQTPQTTTYNAQDANEIYLDLGTSFIEYNKRNSESNKGWTFQRGDRLRFLYKVDGSLREFLEVEIKDQRGNEFVIPYIETSEIFKGEVVEVFRLKTKREKQFLYEIAEYIKVIDPYTAARRWNSTTIELNTGDAYRRTRRMVAKNAASTEIKLRNIEDPTPSEYTTVKDNDIGRPDFVNDNNRQLRRKSVGRFGGKYLPQSLINNMHSFNAEDEFATSEDDGAITILEEFDDVVFVAQWDKCHTRLINKQSATLGDGQNIILNANRFISDAYPLSLMAGCRNPESHAKSSTGLKFFDSYRGMIVQYSKQAGLANVSGFDDRYSKSKLQDNFFLPLAEIYKTIDSSVYHLVSRCYGVMDKSENKEYTLTIKNIDLKNGDSLAKYNGTGSHSNIGVNDAQFATYGNYNQDTKIEETSITYSDKYNLWHGFRSYTPEMWGELNNNYIGFIGGQLWLMEKGIDYGVFFGVEAEQILEPIFNLNPSDLKSFLNWNLETNEKWSNPDVEIYNLRAFREIKSRTPDAFIKQMNGGFYAPFLMDTNTPNVTNPLLNGNKLTGETLKMRISNNSRKHVLLYAINIYAQYMPRTNF